MRRYIKSSDSKELQDCVLIFEVDPQDNVTVTAYCGFCNHRMLLKKEDEVCPACGNDLLFPTWVDI